jgi:hypothetical protein
MAVIRDRVLQNTHKRTTNELQEDSRSTKRSLRMVRQLAGKRRQVTIAATSSATVLHLLGYVPRGYQIESGDNNSITMTASDREKITFANAAANPATITVWIY